MSRTSRGRKWRGWYSTESPYARHLTRRRWRREGKKHLDDAPPQRGTQGWMTH